MAKGSGTRSGLLWEVERILDECEELPQILLMENVPDVIGKKNIHDFQQWQSKLEQLGYNNFVKIINAKDFGVPQNRSRCFMVSILGNYYYEFPESIPLTVHLKDMLEMEVEKKFYLSEKQMKTFRKNMMSFSSCTQETNDFRIMESGQLALGSYDTANRVYDTRGLSPTLNTMQGGNQQPKITVSDPVICASRGRNINNPDSRVAGIDTVQRIEVNESECSNTLTTVQKDNMVLEQVLYIPEATEKGYASATDGDGVYINRPHQKRGCVQKDMIQTLKTSCADVGVVEGYSIRKLTPLECWRLMGFQDEDFYKAKSVVSNSQLYKQAGNSIVRNVLVEIFRKLLQ